MNPCKPIPAAAPAKAGIPTFRSLCAGLALLAATGLLALGSHALTALQDRPDAAGEEAGGWGAEAIQALKDGAQSLSPIALANACGLGASSCFRCHNGKRAPAPASSTDQAPWHHDHRSVNYSCAGCHQGNPRILKQEIAHRSLIGNPVAEPEKSCAGCHGAADGTRFADLYRQNHPHLK